jgi:hypothetical protein
MHRPLRTVLEEFLVPPDNNVTVKRTMGLIVSRVNFNHSPFPRSIRFPGIPESQHISRFDPLYWNQEIRI